MLLIIGGLRVQNRAVAVCLYTEFWLFFSVFSTNRIRFDHEDLRWFSRPQIFSGLMNFVHCSVSEKKWSDIYNLIMLQLSIAYKRSTYRDQTGQTDQIPDFYLFHPSVLKEINITIYPNLFSTKHCSYAPNGYDSHHLICHFITQLWLLMTAVMERLTYLSVEPLAAQVSKVKCEKTSHCLPLCIPVFTVNGLSH